MIEKFNALVNAIKNSDCQYKQDDLEMLDDDMMSFGKYVDIVYQETYRLPLLRARLDDEDLREAIQDLDKRRRICHEAAIAACSTINKTCDYYNVDRFCPETDDRYIVADFCAKVSASFYLNGINKSVETIDNVIAAMGENHKIIERNSAVNHIIDIENQKHNNIIKEIDEEIDLEDNVKSDDMAPNYDSNNKEQKNNDKNKDDELSY